MGVYDRQIAAAKRMIAKYGEACTIYKVSDTPGSDPQKPWEEGPNGPVAHTNVRIAFFPLNERQRKTVQVDYGELTGYESAYIAQLPFKLGLKDYIVRSSGETLNVVEFDELNPNGEGVILYTVIVKL